MVVDLRRSGEKLTRLAGVDMALANSQIYLEIFHISLTARGLIYHVIQCLNHSHDINQTDRGTGPGKSPSLGDVASSYAEDKESSRLSFTHTG